MISFLNNIADGNIGAVNPATLFFTIFINSIASIGIFALLYFLIKNISYKLFSFKNINYTKKILIHIFLGFLFSGISPLLLYIGKSIDSSYSILTQVFVLTTFSLFTSTISIIGILPTFIISNIFLVDDPTYKWFFFALIFYFLSSCFVFIIRFFFENNIKTILMTSPIYFGLLIVLVATFYRNNDFTNFAINMVINFVLFYLLYWIALTLTNIIDKTYNLRLSIQYDGDYFVKSTYAFSTFEDYLLRNNIDTGVLITFDILGIERIVAVEGKDFAERIEKNFISYLVHSFGEDTFYFKTSKNKYAIFRKINKENINLNQSIVGNNKKRREDNDFLYDFQKKLDELPKGVDFNNKKYDVNIIGFASIYGVNSSDFGELINNNEIIKETWNKEIEFNSLQLYETHKIRYLNEYNQLVSLTKKIKLNSFNLKLVEILGGKNIEDMKGNYLTLASSSFSEGIFSKESLYAKYKDEKTDLSLIMRNFAWRALALFSNYAENIDDNNKYKLIIDYPIYELKKDQFTNYNFLAKLRKNNVDPHNVIINFDVANIIKMEQSILAKIVSLKKEGVNICFDNINETNLVLIKQIKPNFVLLNNRYSNNDDAKYYKKYLTSLTSFLIKSKIGILFKQ